MSFYLPLAPEIFLCCAALAIVIVDLFVGPTRKMLLAWLSLAVIVGTAVILYFVYAQKAYMWGGMFIADDYSIFFRLLFLMAAGLTILLSITFMRSRTVYLGEYYVILLFTTLGMMLLSASGEFISMFVALELMAISFYLLTAFRKDRRESNEAGLKYFILGSIASTVMLFGISLIFGLTGSTEFAKFSALGVLANDNKLVMSLALLLIMAGLGLKVTLAPFHMWAPDVYEGAPTPITAFLSVGSKAAAFAVFIRLFVDAFGAVSSSWMLIVMILSMLTMFIGNLSAIPQRRLKRFLAYSSIAQAGYALMGMAMASELGIQSALFYLLTYVFANVGAFAIVIIAGNEVDDDGFEIISGLGRRSPFLALAMTIFMLSLAGIPLLAGFVSKFYVFAAVVEGNMLWMAVIGLINSTIALYYYLNVLREVYIVEPSTDAPINVSPSLLFTVQVCIIGVLLLGLWPEPFLQFSMTAAKALF